MDRRRRVKVLAAGGVLLTALSFALASSAGALGEDPSNLWNGVPAALGIGLIIAAVFQFINTSKRERGATDCAVLRIGSRQVIVRLRAYRY